MPPIEPADSCDAAVVATPLASDLASSPTAAAEGDGVALSCAEADALGEGDTDGSVLAAEPVVAVPAATVPVVAFVVPDVVEAVPPAFVVEVVGFAAGLVVVVVFVAVVVVVVVEPPEPVEAAFFFASQSL